MGIMVYSLLWVMQDLYYQPYHASQDRLSEMLEDKSQAWDTEGAAV